MCVRQSASVYPGGVAHLSGSSAAKARTALAGVFAKAGGASMPATDQPRRATPMRSTAKMPMVVLSIVLGGAQGGVSGEAALAPTFR